MPYTISYVSIFRRRLGSGANPCHPNHIKTELRMCLHVFKNLYSVLQTCGLKLSKHILCEEQLAIFLYSSVTGLSIQHLGKQFQHTTILSQGIQIYLIWAKVSLHQYYRYFCQVLHILTSLLFYSTCKGTSVHLLTLPPLLSPIPSCPLNPYSTLCICTHHHQGSTTSNNRWLCILQVVDSWLLPLLAPPPPWTSIGYMGTCPRDTTAPSASCGLRIRRGLEAWCCIGHYINVLRPNQGSLERSLWISPD
jgi:hypothetical protein